jgi:hypothetical protein
MSDPVKYKLIYLARRAAGVALEDWPRTWRSHAIFASQFPSMEMRLDSVFYCCRIPTPSIGGEPVQLTGVSNEHDGVAVVSSDDLADVTPGSGFSAEDQALIDTDELRVFDMLVRKFSFACREKIVLEGPQGGAAVIRFLARRPGSTREEFSEQWTAHEAAELNVAQRLGRVTRVVHDELVREPPALFPFDGISEMWFADAEDATRALADAAMTTLNEEQAQFCDVDRTLTLLTRVCHRWPRA